ncbi:MAG TPA: hypothetical protein PLG21_22115, partial [Anaerolineae bacterium]|nr:hypothetical protein [Anaerolineae bacterium]
DAVEYLHAQRPPIVHGHISPSHIVITVDGTPHLTGLVDVEGIDNAGVTSADAPFLAPEQHQGRFDERSDIYGLGATLYALLTGKAPADAVARTQGAELVPPRQANRALPEGIDAAILRAMQLDPQQRYTGVPQLRQALAEGLQPGAEAGKDFWGALRGPARRRLGRLPRVLLGIGGTLAILLLAAGVLWRLGLPSLGLDNAPMPTPSPASIATAAMPPTSLPEAPTEALPVARPSVASPSATPAHVASTRAAPPTTAPTSTTAVHPTPTVRWIAGPPASATPRWFPAPTLDSPGQGECTGSIEFTWTWPYALADDEYFDLQVYRIGTQPEGIAWCKERRYRTTGLLLGEGQYYWRVQVIRGQAGQVQGVVSDPSAACLFTWRAAPAR